MNDFGLFESHARIAAAVLTNASAHGVWDFDATFSLRTGRPAHRSCKWNPRSDVIARMMIRMINSLTFFTTCCHNTGVISFCTRTRRSIRIIRVFFGCRG